MPELNELVTFAVYVGDEFVDYIHMDPIMEHLIAALKSDPKIVFVENYKH